MLNLLIEVKLGQYRRCVSVPSISIWISTFLTVYRGETKGVVWVWGMFMHSGNQDDALCYGASMHWELT